MALSRPALLRIGWIVGAVVVAVASTMLFARHLPHPARLVGSKASAVA